MKYYGFVLNDLGNFLIGSCYSEEGEFQFYETGNNIEELKNKFGLRAEEMGFDFVFFHNFEGLPKKIKDSIYKDAEPRMQ